MTGDGQPCIVSFDKGAWPAEESWQSAARAAWFQSKFKTGFSSQARARIHKRRRARSRVERAWQREGKGR